MADKLLVCVSAQQATAAHWRGGRLAACRVFGNEAAGLTGFADFLGAFPSTPVHFLVDTVEEDYRFETLPHTFGSERAEMVGRKLKQHYRNKPYTAAWLQGRESDKRRDDRYLFSALTNPDLLTDWLQVAVQLDLPVAGIYLLPMVSASLPGKLQADAVNLLLVAQHSAGLRLTFLRDSQFRLSRLTRAESGGEEDRTRFIVDEVSNTRLYLDALRIATLEEPLTVLLLDRSDELGSVAQHLAHDNPTLDCVRYGRSELAARFGIRPEMLDASPDALYLHLLGLRPPESNLAPATVTVGFRRHQASRMIYTVATALGLAAVAWSGINASVTLDTRDEIEDTMRRTAQQQAQYQAVTRQFPDAPTSAENLKKAVEISRKIRETTRTPEPMLHILSRALETSPTIVVREFGWKHGTTDIDVGSGAESAPGSPAPAASSAAQGTQVRRQSGLLDGEIRPFRGDYRAAIETINAFAENLARNPAVAAVRVVKLPLNINPGLQISGNTLDSREQAGSAEFRLLLVMKPNA